MRCEWSEDVSLLLDDELSPEREAEVRRHLLGCPACGKLAGECAEVRDALADLGDEPSPDAVEAALDGVLRRGRSRFWHRRVQVSLPLAAALVMTAGLALLWLGLRSAPTAPPPTESLRAGAPAEDGSALDRYDRGGPPALYTRKRTGA